MIKYIILFITLCCLMGCVSFIRHSQVNKIQMNMARNEVATIVHNTKPIHSYKLNVDNQLVFVDVYNLSEGNYMSHYLFAYNQVQQLIYWGYPSEFARDDSKFINDIGKMTVAKLRER